MGDSGAVLLVGETLVDVVTRADGSVTEHTGGSPANVALGLARLGRPTHLFTHLGDDQRGAEARAHLEASGVQLVPGSVQPGPTSVAHAVLGADGGAQYRFEIDFSLPAAPLPEGLLAVHTGSIGAMLQPGAATVERLMIGHHATATTSYDPNLRPSLMGSPELVRAQVETLVATSDVVKLSDEDATWLYPDLAPEVLLERWLTLGPAVVVLTRGGTGSTALCAAGRVDVAAPRVTVADTVGAGDSFTGGVLDGLWSLDLLGADARPALRAITTNQLEQVVRHAVAIAAITVGRPGADPPTRAELGAA